MDVQLENPKTPDEFIFVNQTFSSKKLEFKFKKVKWIAATEVNKPITTIRVSASNFSAHWDSLIMTGWRIASA